MSQQPPPKVRVSSERLEPDGLSPIERSLKKLEKQAPQPKPNIGPVVQSSVLSRLKNFLPELAESNKKLEADMKNRDASEFDVEVVDGEQEAGTAPHIQMDIMCGLFDLKDANSLAAAEKAAYGRLALPGEEQSCSSDGDSSDDDDETEEGGNPHGKQGPSQMVIDTNTLKLTSKRAQEDATKQSFSSSGGMVKKIEEL